MRSRVRTLPALGAFFVVLLALALSACGDNVPGNAVARVQDDLITRAAFDRWMEIAFRSTVPPGSGQPVIIPDPPDYERCVSQLRELSPQPAPGQPQQIDEELRGQCEQQYELIKDQVLQFLISVEWLRGEAQERGVTVDEQEVQAEFERQKEFSFQNEQQYREFLRTAGITEQDIIDRVRIDTLANKVRDQVLADAGEITADDIRQYYRENREQFSQPETRDLQVILTRTREQAQEARAAIEGGQSFTEAAREFSIDQATRDQGGQLVAVSRGTQERALEDAAFNAEPGVLTGPVRTQFGWYVFRVVRINEASQQSLAESVQTIRSQLRAQREQEALDEFVEEFQSKWTERTHCQEDFVTILCSNSEGEQPAAPPGGVPQQGVPQQGGQSVPPGAVPQGP